MLRSFRLRSHFPRYTCALRTAGNRYSTTIVPSSEATSAKLRPRGQLKWVFATAAGLITYYNHNEVSVFINSVPRLLRDVRTAALVMYYYKFMGPGEEARRQTHIKSANAILDLCFENQGIYIKFGQILAQLDYLVPNEITETLISGGILDGAPVHGFDDVVRVFQEDGLGHPNDVFEKFERIPIASASLAQVHEAILPGGERVAVKVQHLSLRDSFEADIACIQGLVGFAKRMFPEFDLDWIVDEARRYLPIEMNFENEGRNCEKCGYHFRNNHNVSGSVVVPEIKWEFTTPRILTMQYMDGVKVTEREALNQLGLDKSSMATLINEAFCEMAFGFGFVHADPHPGNLLLRPNPCDPSQPQLVILDHGLYRPLDDDFRILYCRLWRSLIFGDVETIKEVATKMNVGSMYQLFAAVITSRPWNMVAQSSFDSLVIAKTPQERRRIQSFAQEYARDINGLLGQVPRELLLLLKTNDCLRCIDGHLGSPMNTFVVTARSAVHALAREKIRNEPGFRSRVETTWEILSMEWRVRTFVLGVSLAQRVFQTYNALATVLLRWPFGGWVDYSGVPSDSKESVRKRISVHPCRPRVQALVPEMKDFLRKRDGS
eukprot:Rmarinus@m.17469